ncbi:hypothetical protein GCM10027079_25600 [Sediminivirga luteola]|uniref:DUF433 domain-containing protein n=1 Tax=Sediminivirga luteola TaxID=1774748 RepID=A0A8J2U0W1_9MICO|nr:hypothetical protein GCM10011333_31870 [Sediminivirga luteola]
MRDSFGVGGVSVFDRIAYDPTLMNGHPIIRGMRFPVKTVVRMVAGGMTVEDIQQERASVLGP